MALTKVTYSMIEGASLNVLDFGADPTGVADSAAAIQAAVDAADGNYVFLPEGTYRITQSITRLTSTTDTYVNGMKLVGEGRNTVIQIDTNNIPALLWDVGYTPTGTTTGTLKFTRDSEVNNLRIVQTAGKTGCDGMKLTAAWNLRMRNVWIEGMSGKAINVPYRSDIYAAVSDYWQCFCFDIEQCKFSESGSWGVYFGGGQSPGLWSIRQSTIANNAGGGIYCTQGQFECTDNLIVGNGTYGTSSGGMFMDVAEGPQYVAYIARNEFDTNYNWHFNGYRLTSCKVEQNRFLSSTFDATTGGSIVTTGGYMRPAVHLSLGTGATAGYYPINSVFQQNFHRSTATSAVAVYCYSTGGALNCNSFINNQMDAGSNSSGISRYTGTVLTEGTNTVIHDNVALYGQPYFRAISSSATSIPNTGTATTVVFDSVVISGGGYSDSLNTSTGVFTAPEAGLYSIIASVGLNSATISDGRIGLGINGTSITAVTNAGAGTVNTPILHTTSIRKLSKGDTVRVMASHTSAGSVNTLTTEAYSEFSVYKLPNS